MATKTLLQEVNQVTVYDGDERTMILDDPGGTPTDGYTTTADIRNNIEWIQVTETWTRTGDHVFTVPGDVTATYAPGYKIRYKQGGGYEYGVIGTSVYSAPNTTVTLIQTSDYAMAAGAVSDTYLSRQKMPTDFPTIFNWSPTFQGFSADPAGGIYQWYADGRTIFIFIRQPNAGTSNDTLFRISPPIAAKTLTNMVWGGTATVVDNGTTKTTMGRPTISSGGSILAIHVDASAGATPWTNSGDKRLAFGEIRYQFA